MELVVLSCVVKGTHDTTTVRMLRPPDCVQAIASYGGTPFVEVC